MASLLDHIQRSDVCSETLRSSMIFTCAHSKHSKHASLLKKLDPNYSIFVSGAIPTMRSLYVS
jgi:hypothetical protein